MLFIEGKPQRLKMNLWYVCVCTCGRMCVCVCMQMYVFGNIQLPGTIAKLVANEILPGRTRGRGS